MSKKEIKEAEATTSTVVVKDLEKFLHTALLVPMSGDPSDPNDTSVQWGLPVIIWGEPGIGKSARVYEAGRRACLEVHPVFPSTRQPEDFSGVPVPDGNGGITIECTLGAVRELCKKGEGVLFIDEASTARPAVQAALMGVVLDRRVGDTLLPNEVRIILAANPTDCAAGGWDLEAPMANRLAHIHLPPPNVTEWTSWLLNQSIKDKVDLTLGQEVVAANWGPSYAKASALMAGFMRNRDQGVLHSLPVEGHPDRGRAWPSPRAWGAATRAVATCMALFGNGGGKGKKKAIDPLMQEIVGSLVGVGTAIEWVKWVISADIPDPLDMLTNGWAPDKLYQDRTMAAVTGMTSFLISQDMKDRIKLAPAAYNIINALFDGGMGDIAAVPMGALLRSGLNRKTSHDIDAALKPILLRIGKMNGGELLVGLANG